MKKLVTVSLILCLAVGGYFIYKSSTVKTFYNKCEKNESSLLLDFAPLNGEEKSELNLQKNDVIDCKWSINEGKINVIIKSSDGESIYEGNMQNGEFTININSEGIYYVTVTGKNAMGNLEIIKR